MAQDAWQRCAGFLASPAFAARRNVNVLPVSRRPVHATIADMTSKGDVSEV